MPRPTGPAWATLCAAAALAAAGCAKRLPQAAVGGTVAVDCCGHAGSVELTYLGVGGWIVRHRGSALMTAPFFSNPSLLETGAGRIAPVPGRIEANLPDVHDVAAILVGHAHYDHLMDVPYIMAERAPRAVVYGSETMAFQLAPFGLESPRVRVVEDAAGTVERPGRWIRVAESLRVMPLASDHAPHFAGETLYSGERRRPMAERPRRADEWLAGRTLAWLIDVLDGEGRTVFRIYYQDAVAAAPYGLPPELEDGHGVDVALLVPATYAEVRWHPERLLLAAEPRHVLLGHWENFFQPPSAEPEPVPFTQLEDFLDRLRDALPEGVGWHLPVPGTRFVFRGPGRPARLWKAP